MLLLNIGKYGLMRSMHHFMYLEVKIKCSKSALHCFNGLPLFILAVNPELGGNMVVVQAANSVVR